MIEASSAVSTRKDAFDAGRDAMTISMEKLGVAADIIWVFSAIGYDPSRLLKGIRSVAGGTPIVGCTTDGEISTDGLGTDSVVVLALASDRIKFRTVVAESLSKQGYGAGVKLGEALSDSGCRYMQIFSDPLKGNASRIIDGIRETRGDGIKVAGGAAGDGGLFRCTYQYHDDRVLTDSAVAIGFVGDFHFGTGVGSGWMPFGMAKRVTKSVGNIVYELDGQPALQVYERFLGKYAKLLPAVGVEYPLALLGSTSDCAEQNHFVCRATMGVDRDNGSITFAGDIPEGTMVKMTMGNEQDVIQAAQTAAADALSGLRQNCPNAVPKVVFVYSCMARKIVLGSRTGEELFRVKSVLGTHTPTVGFYTYGEYAPAGKHGVSFFHNETMTLTVIGE